MASPLEGTRLKLLAIIRERGSATVDQLAQNTSLSPATIRRHLDILQRDHLVSYQQCHKPQGRPEYRYSLTEDGHESGYRDYQKLLTLLVSTIKGLSISELSDKCGQDLLAFLMSRISDSISDASKPNGALSMEERVARLEQLLNENGYQPQISRNNGHIEVRLCNCPFRAAALCEESICLSDQYLISNVLGVQPVRQSSIRSGALCCSYLVKLDG